LLVEERSGKRYAAPHRRPVPRDSIDTLSPDIMIEEVAFT
jgi:hypothetical protein